MIEQEKSVHVDFNHVLPRHEAIDARLRNWARWVRVRPHGWQTHPMWRNALTSRQWDVEPQISNPMDTLDSVVIEKAVSFLPVKHREAIRWAYVRKHDPVGMARHLAVSKHGLAELVCEGLTMLSNRA
jgi:hypothetical protein